jgi:sulfatase modifying factor 1
MLIKTTAFFTLLFGSYFFWGCQSPTEPVITPDPTSPFGSLQVNVNTDSALIKLKINNSILKQRNGTGILDSILPGTYSLETSAQYYYTDTSLVQIAANNKTIKNIELYKNVGSLNITVNAEDALIQLWKSNALVKERTGSGIIDNILPGTYILRTSAAIHLPDSSTVTIFERIQTEKTINLTPDFGTVTFNITPSHAVVKIYQNSILIREHNAAGTVDTLRSGHYTGTVEAPYFRTEPLNLNIKAGDKRTISFNMTSSFTISMVDVNSHYFMRGCTAEQGNLCQNDELPICNILLPGFKISKLEVPQHIWTLIMGYNYSTFKDSLYPVHNISWYEAVDFCNKLSIAVGLMPCYTINGTNVTCDWNANGYRLPTESEWEAAARGGGINPNVQSKFSGANTLSSVGWYNDNSFSTVHYPGAKYGNRISIYDLSGNLSEWCWDIYGAYNPSDLSNPKGAPTGTNRVVRGGSFLDPENACRVSARSSFAPETKSSTIGLRLVRKL